MPSFTSHAIAALCLFISGNLSAQVLTADYRFQNNYDSSVVTAPALTDLISPAQTCPAYCNTFGNDTVFNVSTPVLQFPQDNGLVLNPVNSGVLSNNGIYTIGVIFKFQTLPSYRRIIDFKSGTADTGVYLSNGALVLYNSATSSSVTVTADNYVEVVITRDGSGMFHGYVNGKLYVTNDDSTNQYAVIDGNNILRFFQDNLSGGATGEDSAGSVSRIRIYDGALTAEQVALLRPCTPPPPNMISWWDAEGNANDIQDGNDGTLQGGTAFAAGKVGQAFSLDGIDDVVAIGNPANLQFGTTLPFSADAWVYYDSLGDPADPHSYCGSGIGCDMEVVRKGPDNSDGWMLLKQSDNHFWVCLGAGRYRVRPLRERCERGLQTNPALHQL